MTLIVVLAMIAVLLLALVGTLLLRSRSRSASPGDQSELSDAAQKTIAPRSTVGPVTSRAPPIESVPPLVAEPATAMSSEPEPRYSERLVRSRGLFASLRSLGGRRDIDQATFDQLEETLLSADVGVTTTTALLEQVRARMLDKDAGEIDVLEALRHEMIAVLESADDKGVDRALAYEATAGRVAVWLFVGVNGVGKTTTIGKLASAEAAAGRKVLLAAGDTFRAAAADQLLLWGERAKAEVVRGSEGGDPSAVVFDAIQRAGARGIDLVLADTAGRLHTKVNLVEELKKIRRVADREPGEVLEVLLVLDATTGQNAISQARQFSEAVEATGVVLTKLDGTARGGVVIAIQRELGLPVKLVGLGEGADDLVAFDAVDYVDALLAP